MDKHWTLLFSIMVRHPHPTISSSGTMSNNCCCSRWVRIVVPVTSTSLNFFLFSTVNQSQASASSGHVTDQPPTSLPTAASTLDKDEQQLLDAIHAHPNKRDLVLNLLRQMNESTSPSPLSAHQRQTTMGNSQQEQPRSNTSTIFDPYQDHSTMDHGS